MYNVSCLNDNLVFLAPLQRLCAGAYQPRQLRLPLPLHDGGRTRRTAVSRRGLYSQPLWTGGWSSLVRREARLTLHGLRRFIQLRLGRASQFNKCNLSRWQMQKTKKKNPKGWWLGKLVVSSGLCNLQMYSAPCHTKDWRLTPYKNYVQKTFKVTYIFSGHGQVQRLLYPRASPPHLSHLERPTPHFVRGCSIQGNHAMGGTWTSREDEERKNLQNYHNCSWHHVTRCYTGLIGRMATFRRFLLRFSRH